jgi:hypothetical protein
MLSAVYIMTPYPRNVNRSLLALVLPHKSSVYDDESLETKSRDVHVHILDDDTR